MAGITDSFGFLPVNRRIEFDDGCFEPLADLDEKIEAIREATHQDGYFYPPQQVTVSRVVFPKEEAPDPDEIRRSQRPALLYKLPVSHSLILYAAPVAPDFRKGDGGFLVHFLGYVFCYRLQFKGWWHDGRAPMQGRLWSYLAERSERPIVSTAYHTWKAWSAAERTRFINLLYMHIRSLTYEWDWERFMLRYMVFDGCYRMTSKLHNVSSPNHHGRFAALFKHFNMSDEPGIVSRIVDLRNELFHESLWDGGQPGVASRTGFEQADNLWRINDRLLFALAGYKGSYLSTPWWTIGQAPI